MKFKIECKSEDNSLFLIGNSGREYSIKCEGLKPHVIALALEQDIKNFISDCIDKSISDEEIESHAKDRYCICGVGYMFWAESLRELLQREHKKACEWLYNKIKDRVFKLINLF